MSTPDVAIAMRKITAHASTRIARAACRIATAQALNGWAPDIAGQARLRGYRV